jgi:hypothetical protein
MKIKIIGIGAIVALFVLCFCLPVSAQTEVSVQFTGGYTTTWGNSNGDWGAGIYSGAINGQSSPGIICDDFNDEITSGEKWNAYAYQASSLTTSNIGETLFGSTIGITGYAELATLVSMMFGNGTTYGSITGITQAELSSAIWDITTPGGLSGLDAKAQALVAAVEAAFNGNNSKAQTYLATLTNLWILTPTPKGPGEAQEMWTDPPSSLAVTVPEGGTALLYLLLAGFSCFVAMLFSNKSRIGRGITA